MKRMFLIPLLLFCGLAIFLGLGLKHDPREVPSPLIGKAAPAFSLRRLDVGPSSPDQGKFSSAHMLGKVWMLNVWASWCTACREEHATLVEFSRTGTLPIIGLDYKDQDVDAKKWLTGFGDPYQVTAVDEDGRVGIDYGVYGVPETYLIDQSGTIRYKQIGPITPEVLRDKILPLIKELQQ